ncbi:MAG: phosphoribosyl-AMP cyclohydrolase, partial [Raineya sp.]
MLDFNKNTDGLLPAIIQDARTQKILMLGYMNQEAFEKTQAEKIVTFYSRSKKRLWTKGETSGNFLHVQEIKIDCDQDTILIKAQPQGVVCHTGADTCFKETNKSSVFFLEYLQNIIRERKNQ